jgi:ketosteroid isomerase-like protein
MEADRSSPDSGGGAVSSKVPEPLERRATSMRRIVLLAVLAAVSAGLSRAQATAANDTNEEQTRKEILQMEEERSQALLKGDVETLKRLYSPEVAYLTEHGQVLTLDQHLANIKNRKQIFHSLVHKDVKVHVFGDTAAVTGLSVSDVRYTDQKVDPRPRRYTNVWLKQDGQWRCIAHYETPVAQP